MFKVSTMNEDVVTKYFEYFKDTNVLKKKKLLLLCCWQIFLRYLFLSSYE